MLVSVLSRTSRPTLPPPAAGSLTRKPSYPTPSPPTPSGATYYVDAAGGNDANAGTEGAPWQTISKINANAAPGVRFYLKGTFGGTTALCVSSSSGTAANPVQVIVWPGQTATLNNGGGGGEYPPIWASGINYWWLQGVTINPPAGAYSNRAIYLHNGASFWKVVNVAVTGSIRLDGAPDNSFYDCSTSGSQGSVSDNSGDWLNIGDGSNRTFFARYTQAAGAKAYHSCGLVGNVHATASTVSNVHFFDCEFQNDVAGGLQILGYARDTLIEWCRFHDIGTNPGTPAPGSRDGLQITGQGTIFRFNRIYNCGLRGLFLSSYTFGSYLQRSLNGLYHNNVIYNCTAGGIYLHTTADAIADLTGNVFENNIVWANNAGGASEGNGYFEGEWFPLWVNLYNAASNPWASDDFNGNIVRNNLIARGTGDTRFAMVSRSTGAGNQKYTLAQWNTAFGAEGCTNNIGADDPEMVAPGTQNFRLQATSPCIDQGYATGGVGYLGAAVDIGAYEYGGDD